jgi:hypothetical protein
MSVSDRVFIGSMGFAVVALFSVVFNVLAENGLLEESAQGAISVSLSLLLSLVLAWMLSGAASAIVDTVEAIPWPNLITAGVFAGMVAFFVYEAWVPGYERTAIVGGVACAALVALPFFVETPAWSRVETRLSEVTA